MPARGSSGRGWSRPARGLLVAGTTSDAGKSFVVTGLCRLLARRGWSVVPFKAANMSLNAVAAEDGGEMASAQAVQCVAARVPARTVSNPVLFKSEGPGQVEVIVRGRTRWRLRSWAREMPRRVPQLRSEVRSALRELERSGAFIVAEGAGSPAEVNLRRTDLANLDVAESLDAPVLLVADLERGGAIAQLVGTLELLREEERRRIAGLLLNRMRGEASLLRSARRFLERRTGIPVLGVLPYLPPEVARLPPEDSLSLQDSLSLRDPRPSGRSGSPSSRRSRLPRVGLLRLPHVSNFSDFTPLESSPEVRAEWVEDPRSFEGLDVLVLPGTRRTVDDLRWMREQGWERAIHRGVQEGRRVVGFCGGYQILGAELVDPRGFEGSPGRTRGLGLLPISTTFRDPKVVAPVTAEPLPSNPWAPEGRPLDGFEMHRGRTTLGRRAAPLFLVRREGSSRPRDNLEGASARQGRTWGTVLHGLLEDPRAVRAFAAWARGSPLARDEEATGSREEASGALAPSSLDRACEVLADLIEENVDLPRLGRIVGRRLEATDGRLPTTGPRGAGRGEVPALPGVRSHGDPPRSRARAPSTIGAARSGRASGPCAPPGACPPPIAGAERRSPRRSATGRKVAGADLTTRTGPASAAAGTPRTQAQDSARWPSPSRRTRGPRTRPPRTGRAGRRRPTRTRRRRTG